MKKLSNDKLKSIKGGTIEYGLLTPPTPQGFLNSKLNQPGATV